MEDFQEKIENSLILGKIDKDKEFMPEGQFSKLVTKDELKSLLPSASSSLIDFVCRRLRRVFLIIVICRSESDNLLPLIQSCQDSGMTDDHLPIENIARNRTCKSFNRNSGGSCTHDSALDFFHKDWKSLTIKRFFEAQWTFCSPVFNSEHQPELEPHVTLPFTWVSETIEQGHFSQVREAMIHPDHCQGNWDLTKITDKDGTVIKGVRVAAKELKNLSEPGYKVGTAWEKETAALNQISKLVSLIFSEDKPAASKCVLHVRPQDVCHLLTKLAKDRYLLQDFHYSTTGI